MKLLFCCESYWPHRGGVQEVIRQIAERMAAAGHEVSVAARAHPDRKIVDVRNGVRIHSFDVSGSLVAGIKGEVDRYRKFVRDFDGDAILIKAAQQWSFDALWPVLDEIKARKVFVPCGFSGLFEPAFADYFRRMPEVLGKFDHLIFYAERYRDIDFARTHGITNFSIIPNGASEIEFGRESRQGGKIRQELGIPENDLVLLTVGAPTAAKGHEILAEAFAEVDTAGRGATLILNGDWPARRFNAKRIATAIRHLGKLDSLRRGIQLFREAGLSGLARRMFPRLPNGRGGLASTPDIAPQGTPRPAAPRAPARKTVLPVDLPREKVIEAFFEADLFVFASKIEYSPLVLFESVAAGTPFLTVPVGNAAEIVRWTGGGWLCPAEVDSRGYVKVSPSVLAREIEKGIGAPERLRALGEAGRQAWREHFTWRRIAELYEHVLRGESVAAPLPAETV